MKTVETVKPNRGTFAGCCRFEAFSFGSIRIGGRDPVEMQAASRRHRNGRPAGHGRSEKGSQAPPCPVAHAADSQGD